MSCISFDTFIVYLNRVFFNSIQSKGKERALSLDIWPIQTVVSVTWNLYE